MNAINRLNVRQREVLSLMGVTLWRQRSDLLTGLDATSERGAFVSAVHPGKAEGLLVIVVQNQGAQLGDTERKLLQNVLFAINIRLEDASLVEVVTSADEAADQGLQAMRDLVGQISATRVLWFGDLSDSDLAETIHPLTPLILPGLEAMRTCPEQKKICWQRLSSHRP